MSAGRNSGNSPDPNPPRPPTDGMGSGMQLLDGETVSEADAARRALAEADKALDERLSLAEADAQRAVPRPRTDSLDERFARRIPPDNATRTRPSSRLKKRLSKQKNEVLKKQPAARRAVLREFFDDGDKSLVKMEALNRALAATRGNIHDLGPEAQTSTRRLDRIISDYERTNVGVATVYTPIQPPAGMTNDQLADRFREMAEAGGGMTFDRYVVADHSIHEAVKAAPTTAAGAPLVFEYETARGAYLGGSDSVPNGTHLLARGNRVSVLGVKDVTVQNPDGSTFVQRVVQVSDRTDPDLRTTAKP